jgi:hypothetical protein
MTAGASRALGSREPHSCRPRGDRDRMPKVHMRMPCVPNPASGHRTSGIRGGAGKFRPLSLAPCPSGMFQPQMDRESAKHERNPRDCVGSDKMQEHAVTREHKAADRQPDGRSAARGCAVDVLCRVSCPSIGLPEMRSCGGGGVCLDRRGGAGRARTRTVTSTPRPAAARRTTRWSGRCGSVRWIDPGQAAQL